MGEGAAALLVGRASQIEVVVAAANRARRGEGTAVLVEGEPGIGKSSLVEVIATEIRDGGYVVLRAACYALGQVLPFGAIAELLQLRRSSDDPRRATLAALLRDNAPGGVGPNDTALGDIRYRVVEEIVELVEAKAGEAPLAMIVEDLHWADPSTLLALRTMAARLMHLPVLLLGTFRPLPRSPELAQLYDDLTQLGALTIELEALDDSAVAGLVRSELGACPGPVLQELVARAGGNPLWIVEILRSLATQHQLLPTGDTIEATRRSLPESLSELVVQRLGYLPPATLELLRLASVLGDPFVMTDLARVARRPTVEVVQTLDAAFRACLIVPAGENVIFRHQLVRDAIYEQIPLPTRVALHRDIAAVLGAAGAPLSQVAAHMSRGATTGDVEAVRWLWDAAREALSGAPGVSAELLGRAGELLPAGHPERDLLEADRVDALIGAGRVAQAVDLARATLRRPHHGDVGLRLRLALVSVLSLQNRPKELLAEIDSGLLELPGLSAVEEALVLSQTSWAKTFSGDLAGGENAARQADASAERLGAVPMAVAARGALCVAIKTQGRYAEALAIAEEAVRMATVSGDEEALRRHPHFYLAMTLADCDRLDEARTAFGRVLVGCDDIGGDWIRPDTQLYLGELRFLAGDWDDAVVELEAGLEAAMEQGTLLLVTQSRAYLAIMAASQGRTDVAKATLASCEAGVSGASPGYGGELLAYASALVAGAEGRDGDALRALEGAWELDTAAGNRYYHRYLGPSFVRLALSAGHTGAARAAAEVVGAGAELAPEVPSVRATALHCAGLVAGDADLMGEAVALAATSPRRLGHAHTCEDAAAVALAAGEVGEARALFERALAAYETLGAQLPKARVTAALRRLGVRRSSATGAARPLTGWRSLTDTEVKVAMLVAEGLTNRSIAARLYVSPHTVNTHLRHIFQKTGVSTRAALAGLAHREGGSPAAAHVANGASG